MKYFLKTTLLLLFAVFLASSCKDSYDSLVDDQLEENPVPDESVSGDPGSADFSNYVAIGNSLTAGLMDGALYNDGQANSIPALLAGQLSFAGGPDPENFNQPDINSELGFNSTASDPGEGVILGRYKLDTSIPGPSPTLGGETPAPYTGDKSALNNFGVPGVRVGHLLSAAVGDPNSGNPYYARFASDPGNSTILGDAISAGPTFFTLWIGNNDVLEYAIGGASDENELTDTGPGGFPDQFNTVITQLEATGAKGVVVTIPSLLGVPFFQAVSYNAIPLDQETADQLNAGYQSYNNGVAQAESGGAISAEEAQRRHIEFSAGNNAFVIVDESLTDVPNLPKYRQAEPTDLMVLPLGSVLGQDLGNGAYGLQDPVTDQHVLIPQEQQQIETIRAQFNQTIEDAIAGNSDIVLYDTNSPNGAFADIFGLDGEQGIRIDGQLLQPDFSPNGVFSTDGIHPNSRGNAILANEIIDVIEASFGATIPDVDVLDLPSVQTCAGNCVSNQQQKPLVGKIKYNADFTR